MYTIIAGIDQATSRCCTPPTSPQMHRLPSQSTSVNSVYKYPSDGCGAVSVTIDWVLIRVVVVAFLVVKQSVSHI